MEERFQFKHVHSITGTFVVVLLGVLIAAVLFAGRSQRWFIGNVPLRIILPEAGASGIRQGSEVYFLGTLVGSVSDVRVDPAGRMQAFVNIRRDFFLFVRADSSAVVKRKFGVVGDAYFEITRGHGSTLPEKNASIVCNEQLPSALEAAVEEVRSEAIPALKKLGVGLDAWTVLGTNLLTTRERVDQLLVRVDTMAAGLQEGKGTVGQLLSDPQLAEELKEVAGKAKKSLDELEVTLENLKITTENLKNASTNLPAISHAINEEAKDLPGLVAKTQSSMNEVERLVIALQRHWLVRRYLRSDEEKGVSDGKKVRPREILRTPRDTAR